MFTLFLIFVLAVLVAVPSLMRFSVYITHIDINNGINMNFRNIKKKVEPDKAAFQEKMT